MHSISHEEYGRTLSIGEEVEMFVVSFVLLFFLTIEGRVQKLCENNSEVVNLFQSSHIIFSLHDFLNPILM